MANIKASKTRERLHNHWRHARMPVLVDYSRETISIDGVTISRHLFRSLADGANEGVKFRLVKAADKYGSVTVETIL